MGYLKLFIKIYILAPKTLIRVIPLTIFRERKIMEGFEATGDFVRDYGILSPTEWLSLYGTDEMLSCLEKKII